MLSHGLAPEGHSLAVVTEAVLEVGAVALVQTQEEQSQPDAGDNKLPYGLYSHSCSKSSLCGSTLSSGGRSHNISHMSWSELASGEELRVAEPLEG